MANSYHHVSLQRFGLIDDDPSTATRVFSEDPTQEVNASVRQVLDNTQTPEGETYFSGFESEVGMSSADIADIGQGETYMANQTGVKLVGIAGDFFVVFHDDTRIRASESIEVGQPELVQADYVMRTEGGGRGSHGAIITRNFLTYLQEEDSNGQLTGGWADTDNDGVPEGYSAADLKSTAFSSNVFEAFVDTGTSPNGNLGKIVPFPLDNETVRLSVEITQVLNNGNDGNHNLRIEALSDIQGVLTSSSKTFTTTGRKFVDLTTPADTYFLAVYPFRGTSVSNENAKAKIKNPCLRVDGSSTYVPK